MDPVVLTRTARFPFGVFGEIRVPNGFRCVTVERPWLDNEPWVSCIPPGLYEIKKGWFNRGDYQAIDVLDVPKRAEIKIHAANYPHQLAGCIAPGQAVEVINGKLGVTASRHTLAELIRCLVGYFGTEKKGEMLVRWGIEP